MRSLHLAHLRLANQFIVGSTFTTPLEAVRWMVAMQAQDFVAAKWAVGLRTPGCTDADVEAALARGEIVRSWPMRGTLHFTAAEDMPWILALTAERTIASAATRHAGLGLDARTFGRAREVATKHLAGGKALTRQQMLDAFEQAGIETGGQRGYHILWRLAQDGTLCFGPPRGKEQTFVLLDEWVKEPLRFEREEALGELTRRYFISHGPATVRDFAWWMKLTLKDARAGIAIARPHLAELTVDDTVYLMAADAEDRLACAKPPAAKSVALLPGFDEYLLGYADRSAVLDAAHSQRIVPGGNGVFAPTIVSDGRVVGTWRRVKQGKESAIEMSPFVSPSADVRKKVGRAVREYGRFLGAPLTERYQ